MHGGVGFMAGRRVHVAHSETLGQEVPESFVGPQGGFEKQKSGKYL